MVGQLPSGTIRTGHRLVALKDNGNLTYTLTFQVGAGTTQVVADHVVLALPFSTLRQVDLTRTNLSPRKRTGRSTAPARHQRQGHVAGRRPAVERRSATPAIP